MNFQRCRCDPVCTKVELWTFQDANVTLYANCCTVLLYLSRYGTVRLIMLSLFSMCRLLVWKLLYYKPFIVQYCIADRVTWVPRLTLLELWINWNMNKLELWINCPPDSLICSGLAVFRNWPYLALCPPRPTLADLSSRVSITLPKLCSRLGHIIVMITGTQIQSLRTWSTVAKVVAKVV